MSKYNMGWGNSRAVRSAFLEMASDIPVTFGFDQLNASDYPTHEGNEALVERTRVVIERQTGLKYNHIFLTNGATGGVVIALRAYKEQGRMDCHTRQAPYYVKYPVMIRAAGLSHLDETFHINRRESVVLLDLPSNPEGHLNPFISRADHGAPVILDGVYFNRVYMNMVVPAPEHDALVGSYSKLLGMNGIRVGWIATNDDLLAVRLADLVTAEYCGLSDADSVILNDRLEDFPWDSFELIARGKLDYNRGQWQRLERFFGGKPVNNVGMFHYCPLDTHAKKLLDKTGVIWTSGTDLGTSDDFGRFNLGQENRIIEKVVSEMLKNDKIWPKK